MPITDADRSVLLALAEQKLKIAELPAHRETIAAWKKLNALEPIRPMFMIDQIPWHEMNVDDELTLRVHDPFLRTLEDDLRKSIYRWKHMPADRPVVAEVVVPKVIRNSGFGITTSENISVLDPQNDVVGHSYNDEVKTDADLERIRPPTVALDERATAEHEEKAREVFDGVIEVRMQGEFPALAPWDVVTQWRGVETVLVDLVERPEFLHRLVSRLVDAYLVMLDSLQNNGLLGAGQQEIHCTGAWTDELPKPGHDPTRPRTHDLWTFGMAQIFGSVSPAMYDEFEIPYIQKIYSRFGLGYYGCCEPLHDRIHLVRKIPNVRKISMSPWAKQETGAKQIQGDYVFSRKPPPFLLAMATFSPEAVEDDLRHTLGICAEYGCPLELILKDISTVRYEPQRLWQWARIARRLVFEA